MERLTGCQELFCKNIDGMDIHQIQFFYLYIFDAFEILRSLFQIPRWYDHRGACIGEHACGFKSNTCIAPGNDGVYTFEIDAIDHFSAVLKALNPD